MDHRLDHSWTALRFGIGLTAAVAGLDKFFNLLVDWGSYLSPLAAELLPVAPGTFMGMVGIMELAVGIAILTNWTRVGAYAASAWLLGIAANLVLGGFYDVAVRDVVIAIAAYTLARVADGQQAPARNLADGIAERRRGHQTA